MRKFVIYLTTGWAGFYVMALELLAGRMLFPYFGGTQDIWGGIICIFLVGMSLGYLTGGSLSRMGPTVRMLGVFLFAAAASTLIIIGQSANILDWVFRSIMHPGYGALTASFAMFILPSYVLGMVAPYATRLLVTDEATSGVRAGWLYFTGAVGGAAGTILTSFYLVLWLDVFYILLLLLGVSVALGLAAFLTAARDDGY